MIDALIDTLLFWGIMTGTGLLLFMAFLFALILFGVAP